MLSQEALIAKKIKMQIEKEASRDFNMEKWGVTDYIWMDKDRSLFSPLFVTVFSQLFHVFPITIALLLHSLFIGITTVHY